MAIPSSGDIRGQRDATGFASTAEQMEAVWIASRSAPSPRSLGESPPGPAIGALCPHDDYLLAARIYRRIMPLVQAKTVVIVGVFHRYKAFGSRGRIVLDSHRAWRSPGGEITVSPLREELAEALGDEGAVIDDVMHDSEHSIEAVAYWLGKARPDVEILPVLAPAGSFERIADLARIAGEAIAASATVRGMRLGEDIALVVSSDAVHYGRDFTHTPFGEGPAAHARAVERDIGLLTGPLAGPVSEARARDFFTAIADPRDPDTYRIPWCGRFAIPFGALALKTIAERMGENTPIGWPLAYATTAESPELPLRGTGIGTTGPADYSHFVGLPALAYYPPKA
ncbi:MAG: AmmeMemoRadiSam system protein B [Spirochaetae bacterium HGW-Spirochaetae-3]|jgi:AmmeMemoRadiSam system protein B|nr:MAG: AmmeMemoRadiSam system protein B [Spirochaetae bacterium HGW-Spirochaetae-3]